MYVGAGNVPTMCKTKCLKMLGDVAEPVVSEGVWPTLTLIRKADTRACRR